MNDKRAYELVRVLKEVVKELYNTNRHLDRIANSAIAVMPATTKQDIDVEEIAIPMEV